MSNNREYLYGLTDKESSYVVQDYPWGFKLRTQVRYWVESKPKFGQRHAKQTMNPKNGLWCAPKYGIYYTVIVMYLDENNHVQYDAVRPYMDLSEINEFRDTHRDYLNTFQLESLDSLLINYKEYYGQRDYESTNEVIR